MLHLLSSAHHQTTVMVVVGVGVRGEGSHYTHSGRPPTTCACPCLLSLLITPFLWNSFTVRCGVPDVWLSQSPGPSMCCMSLLLLLPPPPPHTQQQQQLLLLLPPQSLFLLLVLLLLLTTTTATDTTPSTLLSRPTPLPSYGARTHPPPPQQALRCRCAVVLHG